MKNQALFSSKDKCHLLQFLFGTLRVNIKIKTRPVTGQDNSSDSALPIT